LLSNKSPTLGPSQLYTVFFVDRPQLAHKVSSPSRPRAGGVDESMTLSSLLVRLYKVRMVDIKAGKIYNKDELALGVKDF